MYGHFTPTPVAFKGIVFSSLGFQTLSLLRELAGDIIRTLVEPGLLLVLAAIAPLVAYAVVSERKLLRQGPWSLALFVFVAAGLGWGLTKLSSRAVGWSGNNYDRYGIPLFPALLVLFAVGLTLFQERGLYRYARMLATFVPALLALLIMVDRTPLPRDYPFNNRTWAYDAGALTQDIVAPTDLVVSTSEMNTFGLAVKDRQVLDFWGYSNPAIAYSDLCIRSRVRIAPDEFLRVRPDLFWAFVFTLRPTYNFNSVERGIAEFASLNREANNAGDMMKVLTLYDVLVVLAGERQVVYLARKDR